MAHMLVHFWPGATEANYQAEIAAVLSLNSQTDGVFRSTTWLFDVPERTQITVVSWFFLT